MGDDTRRDQGWLPYAAPLIAFILLAHFTNDVPAGIQPWMLAATALIPAVLLWFYGRRGAYPRLGLRRKEAPHVALDVLVGLASAALWVLPYLFFDFDFGIDVLSFLATDREVGFDPHLLGPEGAPLMLLLRLAGFALVVPVAEELFVRGFVMRLVQAHETDTHVDFRDLPIGRYTRLSFWITAAIFTLGHAPWEWWVALPWFVVTSLWFFYRRTMASIIVVHLVANASIFAFVAVFSGRFADEQGRPLPLWFFL